MRRNLGGRADRTSRQDEPPGHVGPPKQVLSREEGFYIIDGQVDFRAGNIQSVLKEIPVIKRGLAVWTLILAWLSGASGQGISGNSRSRR